MQHLVRLQQGILQIHAVWLYLGFVLWIGGNFIQKTIQGAWCSNGPPNTFLSAIILSLSKRQAWHIIPFLISVHSCSFLPVMSSLWVWIAYNENLQTWYIKTKTCRISSGPVIVMWRFLKWVSISLCVLLLWFFISYTVSFNSYQQAVSVC